MWNGIQMPKEGAVMTIIHTIQQVTGPTLTIPVPPEFEGQQVEVEVRVVAKKEVTTPKPGDGLLRTEGALADDPYWDAIMDEIYQERKNDTRKENPA
jgi:hypothetical protein